MSEETGNSNPFYQIEDLWKQWHDTSYKVWSDALTGATTNSVDPYGLYRMWLQTFEEGQNAGTTPKDGPSAFDPAELWKQWLEATSQAWSKSFEANSGLLELTTRWLEMMEETRLKLLKEASIPTDPFTFFKQWYASSHEAWSKAIEEIIGSEKFVEEAGQSMENYATFYKNFHRFNEDYFSHLQLVTRADLARTAEMIIALEDKVDGIQDAFEDFQGQYLQFATRESIQQLATYSENLEKRLDGVEQKLDKLFPLLEQIATQQPDVKTAANRTSRSSNSKTRTPSKAPKTQSKDTHSSSEE